MTYLTLSREMDSRGRVIIDEDAPYKIICIWWMNLFNNTIYNNMSREAKDSKNPDRLGRYINSINVFTNKFMNDEKSINAAIVGLHQEFTRRNYADTVGIKFDQFVKFYVNLFIPSHTIEAINLERLHALKKKLLIETLIGVSNTFSRSEYATTIVYNHANMKSPAYTEVITKIGRQLLEDLIAMRKAYNDKCNIRGDGQEDMLKKLKARIYTVESEKRELSDKVDELREKFKILADRYTQLATTYNGLLEHSKRGAVGAAIMLQPVPIQQTPSLAPSVKSATSSTKRAAVAAASSGNNDGFNKQDNRADRYVNNLSNILVGGNLGGDNSDKEDSDSDSNGEESSDLSISDGGDDDDL